MISKKVIIIGAGPSGLGAALELQKNHVKDILIIEKNPDPGGLCRTVSFQDNRFDIGPHIFFSKNKEINELWHNIAGNEFITHKKLTKIYYKNKFFDYPLKPLNTLKNLGVIESSQAIIDYIISRIKTDKGDMQSFEKWVYKNFGKKLYQTFFRTFTEKFWGIDCKKISADWAAQRIKSLNLSKAILDAINPFRNSESDKKIGKIFHYPLYGTGVMYERMAEKIMEQGGTFLFDTMVEKINIQDNKVESITLKNKNAEYIIPIQTLFSSMPLTKVVKEMKPKVREDVLRATTELFFRDHISINLILDSSNLFPEHWLYIHSPKVKMARIVNYNNFSSCMTANKKTTALGVEYFVFQGDDIWNMTDRDIIEVAKEELQLMNLLKKNTIKEGFVVRNVDSYPVYFLEYKKHYSTVRKFISNFVNLVCIGRGGIYRYINQDYSLYTGILSARNYCGIHYDVWKENR